MFGVAICFSDFDYFSRVIHKLVNNLKQGGVLIVGDLLCGKKREGSQYLFYNKCEIIELMETFGHPYSIQAQSRLKRQLNLRYDLVVYKD